MKKKLSQICRYFLELSNSPTKKISYFHSETFGYASCEVLLRLYTGLPTSPLAWRQIQLS